MIPLYGLNATGNSLVRLDDPDTTTDRGAEFTAFIRPTAFDQGPASGFGTLRRLAQVAHITGQAQVTVTPWGDGREFAEQVLTATLLTTIGLEHFIEVPAFVPATTYTFTLSVTSHAGQFRLLESDQWFVPRRTGRRTYV